MPDPDPTDPPQNDPPASDPKEPTAEDKYWARFASSLDDAVERAVKKHLSRRVPGQQRQGRTTLPDVFHDFMFGKPKDQ